MKSKFVKLLSVVLALTMVLVTVPMMTADAANTKITAAVFSDIHYLADNLYDYNAAAWAQYCATSDREMEQANALISNTLELADKYLAEAKEQGSAFVLIPGDLSKDGEYESHLQLAGKFAAFEAETGIPVYVVPGNHDIYNSNGRNYSGDVSTPARITTPQDFETIYKDFGYDSSDENFVSRFVPEEGKLGGGLSYSCKLTDGYLLIAVDSNMYSPDNGTETLEHVTDGRVGPALREWIVEQCDYAKAHGMQPILMQHHNVVQHMGIEEATFFAFVVEDWEHLCDLYADNGIHYVFTGHLHSHDVSSYVSDNGETITDVLTCTLTGYPNEMRVVEFTTDNGNVTMDMESHDVDEIRPVSYVRNGETITYEAPFKTTYSFAHTYGESIEDFAMHALTGVILNYFPKMQAAGGLVNFLADSGLDLEQIIVDALGTNGLAVGNLDILTVSGNLMGFINDFGSQVDEKYINNPDYVIALAQTLLHKLLSFEVSDYACDVYYDSMGIGNTSGPTTLDDFARAGLVTFYSGDENVKNEPVFKDVLEGFESGELAEELFALLRETVINDLLEDELLSNLDFNPGALFPKGTMLYIMGVVLQKTTELLLGKDNSFMNLIASVLSIPLVPDKYSSIDSILDTLVVDEYLTDSQFQGWGHTISWMLSTLVIDEDPVEKADCNYTFTYSGPVTPEATADNYRLPSNIAVTMSEDSSDGAYITWVTKYSVTGTDIQIVPYSASPDFSNGSTVSFKADDSCESITLSYPGADLGIFGLLDFGKEYNRHYLEVSGLEAGTKYSYRIGDAERDWWSEPAVLETADGSDKVTFFHLSDMQSQNATQYGAFNSVLNAAYGVSPDAKFIVSSGDQVDLGTNCKHWKYLFNVNSKYFANTFFMPTTGNHEDEGEVLTSNFMLPNVAEGQNLDTGVYYSYDYNNCHFTVLNTNDVGDDKLSDAQLDWLKEDISSSDAKWKFVVLHKAVYSNGSHYDDKEVKGIRKQLCALMPFLGVDMVLEGHDHVYLRTDAMNANLVACGKEETVSYNGLDYSMKINPKGTIYSIPATSGVKIYNTKDNSATDKLFPRAEAIVDADSPMFSSITVDGDRLYYDAYKVVDGEAVRADSFAIEKTVDEAPAERPLGGFLGKIISLFNFTIIWRIISFVFPFISRIFDLSK